MTKTFLMCVGAQKAGTTWLWHYLKNSENVDFDTKIKEFHVWDVLTVDEFKFFKLVIGSDIIHDEDDPTKSQYLQLKMMSNPSEYFYYFINKLDNCQVTGDFTPQYSALSDDTYNHIVDTFAQFDIETKVVFLMRDPVDRLQSMVRMDLIKTGVHVPQYQQEFEIMVDCCNGLAEQFISDYSVIVPKLDRVFQSNVHYEFYENLFQERPIRKICKFINTPFYQPDYSFNPLPSKTLNVLTKAHRRYFEQQYKPIYDYVLKRFPEAKKLWTYYQK